MYLKSLRLENFLLHKNTEIIFSNPSAIAIIGQNSAGKSSIIEGIYYALTGKFLREISLAQSVNTSAQYSRVEMTLVHQAKEIIIVREYHRDNDKRRHIMVRSRTAGSDDEWVNLGTRSINANWNISEQLFGMDAEAFKNTVVIGQNDIDSLSRMRPGERRELFINLIFNGGTLQKINSKLTQSLRMLQTQQSEITSKKMAIEGDLLDEDMILDYQDELQQLTKKIATTETLLRQYREIGRYRDIAQIFLADKTLDLNTFEQDIQRFKVSYRQQAQKFKSDAIRNRSQMEGEVANLRERFAENKKELIDYERVKKSLEELEIVRSKITTLAKQRDDYLTEKAVLEEAQKITVSNICPSCGRLVTPEDREQVDQHRKENKTNIARLTKEIEKTNQEIAANKERENYLLQRREYLKHLDKIKAEQDTIANRGKALAKIIDDPKYLFNQYQKSSFKNLVESPVYKKARHAASVMNNVLLRQFTDFNLSEMESVRAIINQPSEQEKNEEAILEADNAPEKAAEVKVMNLHELQTEVEIARSRTAMINLRIEKSKEAQERLQALEEQYNIIHEQLETDELLQKALSIRDGAPALALDEILSDINRLASQFIHIVDPNVLSVNTVSKRSTQKDEELPTLEIMVNTKQGQIPFGGLSRSEQVRVSFALRMAMNTFILQNKDIQFLIMDEALSNLDSVSRQRFLNALSNIRVPQLIMITHLDDVAEQFQQTMLVKKVDDRSVVEMYDGVALAD